MQDYVVNVEKKITFMALNRVTGEPKTGARISIQNLSDDSWWDGDSWEASISYLPMTHTYEGRHEYTITFTEAGDYDLLFTHADGYMVNDSYTVTVYPEERMVEADLDVLRGEGANEGIITVTTPGDVPVADADVWVTSDEDGAIVVAGTLQTNSQGQVTAFLDNLVTYYIWVQKDGVNFDNPTEVVWSSSNPVEGTTALGEPMLPSIALEENFNTVWVKYTFPASLAKAKASTDFIVKFGMPIDLTLLTNDNFALRKIISTSPLTVDELDDPFEEIDVSENYNSISRELILHTQEDLDGLAMYFFVVQNLVATTGDVQTEDHIILFEVATAATEFVQDTTRDIDDIIVEDFTLAQPPLPEGATTSLVSCSIIDGAIGITAGTTAITLYFTDTIDASLIRVREEDMDAGTVEYLDITAVQNPTTYEVSITLTDPGVQDNCVYTVESIYTNFEFTGALSPFYVPLPYFYPFTDAAIADPIEWAKLVFHVSKEIQIRLGSNASSIEANQADDLTQYVKYYILANKEGVSQNESFMLGELQISSGMGGTANFADVLGLWETKIFGWGNVRTADAFWPRTGRLPLDRRSSIHREWKTFDRRLD